MLNGMALFAGIGGIEVGLRRWVRTVCYVERDNYAISILRSRIQEGKLSNAPIWDEIRTFDGKPWRGIVDIITGGFPCQDISTAGLGGGIKKNTRSGLWFEMLRIINEIRPTFIFVENVSALTNRGLDIVLGCLSEAGYDARWTDLRASDVGARHRRERIFILAYTDKFRKSTITINDIKRQGELWEDVANTQGIGRGEESDQECFIRTGEMAHTQSKQRDAQGHTSREEKGNTRLGDTCEHPHREDVANCDEIRLAAQKEIGEVEGTRLSIPSWVTDPAENDPSSKSYVGRVANGIPNRVDRIKCLGNAVVPQQAERAWVILTNLEGYNVRKG